MGRRGECGVLDQLVGAIPAGESRALVLAGEPGVGKTALLDYLAGRAPDCRLVRATGVQSEMELAFAALQQLCAPMLDRVERLPGPQGDALLMAFGVSRGPAPDRFVVCASRRRPRGLPVVLRRRPLRGIDALRARLPSGASGPA